MFWLCTHIHAGQAKKTYLHDHGGNEYEPCNAIELKTRKLQLLTSCNNLSQQADIKMRSHGLPQLLLHDDKPVASCQQTCCELIVQTCYQQACHKLFQQIVTSLQMTS